MRAADFDFELPESLIALRPARPRDSARLLVIRPDGALEDLTVRDLPDLLEAGDALVVNATRVIAAALVATRPARAEGGGGPVTLDLNLHQREAGDVWRAFSRPAKRLRVGDTLHFKTGLAGVVIEKGEGGDIAIRFDRTGQALDQAIEAAGAPPLPPYIARKREADEADLADYQTIFAESPGSVAAPTAGLHFTPELFERLSARGVSRYAITLHVGAGTFLPVKSEALDAHVMHREWCALDATTAAALNLTRTAGGRCVAVGTTSLRTLESAASHSAKTAGALQAYSGETDIFITPGFQFRAVDALLTNFHLPRSTLFMLVCALGGVETMKRAYAHAIARAYRFYSYGDACLILTR